MPRSTVNHFPVDYFAARAAFRSEAEHTGGRTTTQPLAARGPQGEELTIDTAVFGDARPRYLLLLTAGVHGVEAPAGSALLRLWCSEYSDRLPLGAAALLVHAVNPWGFAHGRRVNEHNVDLNRNGIDAFPGPENPDYARIDAWLNPVSPLDAGAKFWPGALRHSCRLGPRALRQAIAAGQYAFPRGLFYGGDRRQASLEIFARILSRPELAAVEEVLYLDIHTGLGRRGEYALLLAEPEGTPVFAEFARRFGCARVISNAPDGFAHYAARGTIGAVTARAFPDARVRTSTLEFGTYSSIRVLRALRAENRLFHHGGDPGLAARVHAAVAETFCPDDAGWRAALLGHGRRVFGQIATAFNDRN